MALVTSNQFQGPSILQSVGQGLQNRQFIQQEARMSREEANRLRLQQLADQQAKEQLGLSRVALGGQFGGVEDPTQQQAQQELQARQSSKEVLKSIGIQTDVQIQAISNFASNARQAKDRETKDFLIKGFAREQATEGNIEAANKTLELLALPDDKLDAALSGAESLAIDALEREKLEITREEGIKAPTLTQVDAGIIIKAATKGIDKLSKAEKNRLNKINQQTAGKVQTVQTDKGIFQLNPETNRFDIRVGAAPKKEGKDAAVLANTIRAGKTVIRDGNEALKRIDENFLFAAGGILPAISRKVAKFIPGSETFEVDQLLESVKSNIAIDSLLNIKREGAGLGQVPQKQLELLKSLLGKLDVERDPELLKRDTAQVVDLYEEVVRLAEAEKAGIKATWNLLPTKGEVEAPSKPPEGFTEQITNSRGQVGFKNPQTGQIFVQ